MEDVKQSNYDKVMKKAVEKNKQLKNVKKNVKLLALLMSW